jgi:hypothetical protein
LNVELVKPARRRDEKRCEALASGRYSLTQPGFVQDPDLGHTFDSQHLPAHFLGFLR